MSIKNLFVVQFEEHLHGKFEDARRRAGECNGRYHSPVPKSKSLPKIHAGFVFVDQQDAREFCLLSFAAKAGVA